MSEIPADSVFRLGGGDLVVTPEMHASFDKHGFIIVKSLLSKEELAKLKDSVEGDSEIRAHSYGIDDGHDRKTRLALWNHPGDDVSGMVARCEKVAGTTEQLLGGEVYHYHTKLIMKEEHTGGSFVWHQDYGYWYKNGCLFPDMASTFIAIDKCDVENGCLKILVGSHKAGRIEHGIVGNQTGANLERVAMLKNVCPLVHVELEAGDALFFHANVLHTSDQNNSDRKRWAFIISYNKASNNPVIPHHHPFYTPLKKVPNSAILSCQSRDVSGKAFMDPTTDKTSYAAKANEK